MRQNSLQFKLQILFGVVFGLRIEQVPGSLHLRMIFIREQATSNYCLLSDKAIVKVLLPYLAGLVGPPHTFITQLCGLRGPCTSELFRILTPDHCQIITRSSAELYAMDLGLCMCSTRTCIVHALWNFSRFSRQRAYNYLISNGSRSNVGFCARFLLQRPLPLSDLGGCLPVWSSGAVGLITELATRTAPGP